MVDAIGIGERQGQRIDGERGGRFSDPRQRFGANDRLRRCAREHGSQGEIDGMFLQPLMQTRRRGADDLDQHIGVAPDEIADQRGQEGCGVIVGAAEPQHARQAPARQFGQRLIVAAEDFLRPHEQPAALPGQPDAAPAAIEQGMADNVFELPDLHRERRLRPADARGGAAQRARIGDGDESAQQSDVEGRGQAINSIDISDKNYSMHLSRSNR
jgi:hypothetical protein